MRCLLCLLLRLLASTGFVLQPKLISSTILFRKLYAEHWDFSSSDPQDVLQHLARRGLAFVQTPSAKTLVPGCMATVRVGVTTNTTHLVDVFGTSDAVVSRGLLSVVAEWLQNQEIAHVLDLDASQTSRKLGLEQVLSPGRNDGVASMVRSIQGLLRQETETEETPPAAASQGPKVALLLSGGVDSSVALRLLQQQGYQVTAFYLKIWLEDELAHLGQCPWEDDYRICQEVCEQAGVPLRALSLQDAYKERVIAHTIAEASAGRTPNPDILCNSRVKFGCFYDCIDWEEFDFVATGHYAQVVRDDQGTVQLHRAPDPVKDQSYFLCALSQEQLQRVLFPIGHLEKAEVRQLADDFELPNRNRPDSQGLCFLGKVKFEEFLGAYLGDQPGDIVDAATGEILGRHNGIWYHTVGQRKGIGKVLFPLATSRGPWYVVAKNPSDRIVYCSNQYDQDIFADSRSEFTVESISWITGSVPPTLIRDGSMRAVMKIRHGPRIVEGTVSLVNGSDSSVADVKLDTKDSGLAPGQYVVFYDEDECLGGGIISEKHWAKFLTQRESSQPEAVA